MCQHNVGVGLSPLHEHKINPNFLDIPSEKSMNCNTSENLEHYLLFCTKLDESRVFLLNTIQLLSIEFETLSPKAKTKLLLYGHNSLDNTKNRVLLKATFKYICDSERFS